MSDEKQSEVKVGHCGLYFIPQRYPLDVTAPGPSQLLGEGGQPGSSEHHISVVRHSQHEFDLFDE